VWCATTLPDTELLHICRVPTTNHLQSDGRGVRHSENPSTFTSARDARKALARQRGKLYLEAAKMYLGTGDENNTRAIATESFFWPPALSTLQRETNYRPFLRSSIRHLMRPEHSPDRWWEPRCRLPHFCSALSTSYHCCTTSTLLSGIRHWAYRFSAEHTLLQPRFPLISFLRKPKPVTAAELRDVAVACRQPNHCGPAYPPHLRHDDESLL